MVVSGITSVFRQLCIAIVGLIYPLIPPLYTVFYDLANGRLLTNDMVSTITGNIYILVSVAMLFALGVQLIKSIVNPDLLLDSKKGATGVIKRVVFAVVFVTGIPIAFNLLYNIQGQVMDNALIEKIVIGMPNNSNKKNVAKKSGQYLAAATLYTVIYPEEGATTTSETLETVYNSVINDNINNVDALGNYINESYEDNGVEKYVLHFERVAAILVGVFILYQLILCCFDMGLRLAKLAFLEVTAPVSIIAYVIKGSEMMQKWFKEVMSTFAGVFIKVAALSFMVVGLQMVTSFLENNNIASDNTWLVQLFLICGLLMLVKQLPSLISSLFGVNIDSKGGIKDRLAGMAAVGGIAANAFGRINSPRKAFSTITGAGAGVAGTIRGAAYRGRERAREIRENGGRFAGIRGVLSGVGSGLINTPGGLVRGARGGGFRQYGQQRDQYRETHPENSTLRGRIANTVRDLFGNETAADRMDRDFARRIRTAERANLQIFDRNPDGTIRKDASGAPIVKRELTQAEAAEEKQNLENQKRDIQRVSSNNNEALSKISALRDIARTEAEKANSEVSRISRQIKIRNAQGEEVSLKNHDGTNFHLQGNLNDWKNQIESFKNANKPDLSNFHRNPQGYQDAMNEYNQALSALQKEYETLENEFINKQINSLIGGSNNKFNDALSDVNNVLGATSFAGTSISNNADLKSISDALKSQVIANNEEISNIDNGRLSEIIAAEQDYNDNIANVKARIESEKQGDAYRRADANREAFKAGHGGGGTNTNTH